VSRVACLLFSSPSPVCGFTMSILGCPLLFIYYAASVELNLLISDPPKIYPSVFLANALAAFALNLAVFLLIGKTSALTMNIAGVIKDWMLIFFSYSVFRAPVTRLNLLGYAFCVSGVAIYNYQKLQLLRKKAMQKTKDGSNDKEAGGSSASDSKPLPDEEQSGHLMAKGQSKEGSQD
jgi:hypothetical protein